MNRFYTSVFILSFLLPLLSVSQEYSYTNYSSKEGLAGPTVYFIQQDKEGFLWFGTETGLSRFDGTHFKNFTTTDGLPDNEILKLYVDSRNRVWIIPFKNSICYYWKGKIHNKDNDSVLNKINITSDVRNVIEDAKGNILIQEQFGANVVKPNGEIIKIAKIDGEGFQVFDATLNEKGIFRMALGLLSGPIFVDLDSENLEIQRRPNSFFPVNTISWSLLIPGVEVVRTPDSIFFSTVKTKGFFSLPLPENFVNISALNDSIFVINAAEKCILFNLNQKKVTEELLVGHKVTAALQDREKNIWFATMGEGIFRLASTEFKNLRFNDAENFLGVFSIHKLDSIIYIGTENSLVWSFNPRNGVIRKNKIGSNFQHGRVLSMITAKNKDLIIGTDWGVHRLKGTVSNFPYPLAIKTIVWYEGKLLIAAAGGVYYLDENRQGEHVSEQIWLRRATWAFPHDSSGFYIGTLNGLFDLKKNKEVVFLGEKNSLFRNRISSITKTEDGIFWIATYGAGIVGFKEDKVITHFSQENGLSSNICRNIFVAGNNLWVGTDKGLNRITRNKNEYEITKFTTADGLSSDIINAVYVDKGIVYVGTPGGLTYFDENKISQNSTCDLRITGINSSDRVWNFDTTNFLLPHRDNNIRVEFVGLSYKSAGDIIYKYRLVGLDSSWKTTNETFLSYPALPSGKYELHLVAVNKFGIQSEIKKIDFEIEELIEEKTWFRLLLVLIGVASVWFIVILYIRNIRRKEAIKSSAVRKVTELEQKALKAQMNPHFIFNSLNSIQQYVMDKDTIGANKFITAFSSLIRQTLDFSSKQEITLEEELQYLSTYLELEKTRMEDKFIYEIQVSDQISASEYYIPPMILQPYVENSIRHGVGYRRDKNGKIVINIKREADKVICTVEDNGVGRLVAGQFKINKPLDRQSKGMSLTADRIEMFNKDNKKRIELRVYDLIDEQNNPLGTRVEVSFPV